MILAIGLFAASGARAQSLEPVRPRENTPPNESAPHSGNESLGGQLLEDLGPSLFEDPAAADRAAPGKSLPPVNLDDPNLRFRPPQPLDGLGEDIGPGQLSAPLPLLRAAEGMKQARGLIADHNQASEVQQQVVAQLDELIAELSKQCKGGSSPPSDQPPPPSQRSQTQGSNPGAKPGGQGNAAARDSSDRLDPSSAKPVEMTEIEPLLKDLWGHLPERSREQMLQSFSDEFLPKYELEIEQYYRRLAEERDEDRAD